MPSSQTDANGRLLNSQAIPLPPSPPVSTQPPPAQEPVYGFAEGTAPGPCAYGWPEPKYSTPRKKCVPYHPMCGIAFTCIVDV